MTNNTLISRFKRRVFRFVDNRKYHVIAELLERITNTNGELPPHIEKYIRSGMLAFKERRKLPDQRKIITFVESNGYDINKELTLRKNFRPPPFKCVKCIHIIGAPRSGTSYLYNLLAYQGIFSYFTCDSHSDWTTFNLNFSNKISFENQEKEILEKDTKKLKLRSDIMLPVEAENIWSEAFPFYKHLGGHKYEFFDVVSNNPEKLQKNISAHCAYFNRKYFLSKSPFNSFRSELLREVNHSTFFIHLYRNKNLVAESIAKNQFYYKLNNMSYFSSLEAWHLFTDKCFEIKKNIIHINYQKLIEQPQIELNNIISAFNLEVNEFKIPYNKYK